MKPDDPTLIDGGDSSPEDGRRHGKYRITGRIGEGGMGLVYCALDEELGRKVALKFLPERAIRDPAAEERFLREARAASALDHVHIGTIYGIEDAGDGRRFIVMAYYEGQSLAGLLGAAAGPLGIPQTLRIAAQIASGLAEAHAHGIIHRDIKPSNILITRQGVVKIVDFGLAQVQGAAGELTQDGARLGTPAYMSPEQALGQPVDHRTDLWSLGVVLHEMLAGERPFEGATVPAMLYQIVHGSPRPPGHLPEEVRALLARLLAKDPGERFASAAEVLEALHQAESGEERPQSAVRVRRIPAGAGRLLRHTARAAVFVALLAGGAWLWERTRLEPRAPWGGLAVAGASAGYLEAVPLLKRWDREGNLERAIGLLRESVTRDPSFALGHARLAEAHRIRFALTRNRKDLDTAAYHAGEAIRINGELAPVQVAMGRVQAALGNQDLAMASLERALQLDANDPEAHQAIARQYERLGRLEEAEKSFRRAVELDPDDIAAHDAFGNFLFRQTRFPEAIRQWQEVIRIAPDHSAALVNLSSALCEAGRVSEAIEISNMLLKVKPGAMAWTNLGTAYSRAGRYPEAVSAYRKALEIEPDDPMTWGNLGFVYSWMRADGARAQEAFGRAIELGEARRKETPRDAFLYSDLALYYAKTGRPAAARERLATALGLAPKGPEIRASAAETYELLGDRTQALESVRQALAMGCPRSRLQRNPELAGLLKEAREKHFF
ncbi:MAG: protein kinase [Bryobacteraceae bacterium]|nr:protein kinase [Bryobacteraceae bacterium]